MPVIAQLPSTAGIAAAKILPRSDRGAAIGAWRYKCSRSSRPIVIAALLASAGLHAVVLLAFNRHTPKRAAAAADDSLAISFVIPQLKELEEIDPTPADDAAAPKEIGAPAPMQADLPRTPTAADFVQQIDFHSFDQPDLSNISIYSVPDTLVHGSKLAEGMGKIFNINDLDRIPEAVYQPAPVFPPGLKREVTKATVKVEFIVDVEGRVVNAGGIDSTHPGFVEAAVTGVAKWRFKPGMKGGRKVNTRMQVPIIFRLVENED